MFLAMKTICFAVATAVLLPLFLMALMIDVAVAPENRLGPSIFYSQKIVIVKIQFLSNLQFFFKFFFHSGPSGCGAWSCGDCNSTWCAYYQDTQQCRWTDSGCTTYVKSAAEVDIGAGWFSSWYWRMDGWRCWKKNWWWSSCGDELENGKRKNGNWKEDFEKC